MKKPCAINPRLMDVFTNIVLLHAVQKQYDDRFEKV